MDNQTNINSFQASIGPALLAIVVIAAGVALGVWVANRVV